MIFRFSSVHITALAYELPTEVWTSDDIEAKLSGVYERLNLPLGRLELMTGIRQRHFWPSAFLPSEAAVLAGKKLLQQTALEPDSIDLLINASVCRDRLEPATASTVHRGLGLGRGTQSLDVSNACLGFCNALVLAGGMIESGQISRALIVSGENGRPLMDWTLSEMSQPGQTRKSIKNYFANLTIGAGAVAALVEGSPALQRQGNNVRLCGGVTLTDSASSSLCEGGSATGGEGLQMLTDSEALLQAGVRLAKDTWNGFRDAFGWPVSSLRRVICHQVGKQHQRALLEALDIPLEYDYPTYPELGNIGSVSLPLTLAKALESQTLKSGDRSVALGIGSGLCCMMLGLQAL